MGEFSSGPAVASWGANRLDVFIRGAGNQVWHKAWGGSQWSDWESLGGELAAAPAGHPIVSMFSYLAATIAYGIRSGL